MVSNEAQKRAAKKWRKRNPKKVKQMNKNWYKKFDNKNKHILKTKEWQQSEKGKASARKATIKWKQNNKEKVRIFRKKTKARRKRNFNWILMFPNPFANSVLIDYHHITDAYVVAIPRDLHHLYYGKYHREKTMEIVKQIYLGELDGNK